METKSPVDERAVSRFHGFHKCVFMCVLIIYIIGRYSEF